MKSAQDMMRFEQQLRMLLEEHAQQASGRIRSGLTRARHAAIAQADYGGTVRGLALRGRTVWLPAAAVAAAAITLVIWPHPRQRNPPAVAAHAIASGDLDLLTDRDGLTLVEGGDGQFYEWAVYEAQAQSGQGSGGPARHVH